MSHRFPFWLCDCSFQEGGKNWTHIPPPRKGRTGRTRAGILPELIQPASCRSLSMALFITKENITFNISFALVSNFSPSLFCLWREQLTELCESFLDEVKVTVKLCKVNPWRDTSARVYLNSTATVITAKVCQALLACQVLCSPYTC